MRIAVIEDEFVQAERLSSLLTRSLAQLGCNGCEIDIFGNGDEFFQKWEAGCYRMILLDIFMQGDSGIEIARKIRKSDGDVRLVFCSVSNEFAAESYEVNASYYICKPISEETISAMLKKLNPQFLEESDFFSLPDGNRIFLHDIIYTEYFNHIITFYMADGQLYQKRISQAQMEKILIGSSHGAFFSPIKGIIINFNYVEKRIDDNFILTGGKIVHITRRKHKAALEAYSHFRFAKASREVNE